MPSAVRCGSWKPPVTSCGTQLRDQQGRISDTEYVIYEKPQPRAARNAKAGYGCTRYGFTRYGKPVSG